jgi:LacI family transcriptional regulator
VQRRRATTILDIAATAGVSPATVSRVLTGAARVAEGKRAAVLAAVAELGYRPNLAAQGLVRGRSMAIGVLTQDIASPFFGAILAGIEDGLARSAYHPIFASGNWRGAEEVEALDVLVQRRVDALVVIAGEVSDDRLRELSAQLPLVVVQRLVPGLEDRCLVLDSELGGRLATRHLLDLGHRRIAHVTGVREHRDSRLRLAGYRTELAEGRVRYDDALVVEGDFRERSGVLAGHELLRRGKPFTAVFAANDQMAAGVRLALHQAGVAVPEQVSLVGTDDLEGSAYTIPPLTTVRQPIREIGAAAARAVVRLMSGAEPGLPGFGMELVVRASTAPPPAKLS